MNLLEAFTALKAGEIESAVREQDDWKVSLEYDAETNIISRVVYDKTGKTLATGSYFRGQDIEEDWLPTTNDDPIVFRNDTVIIQGLQGGFAYLNGLKCKVVRVVDTAVDGMSSYVFVKGYEEIAIPIKNVKVTIEDARIVCAFPGIGKTYLSKNSGSTRILDLDSGEFKRLHGELNFEAKYVDAIVEARSKYDFILVSTHEAVRKELNARNIVYSNIFPMKEDKEWFMDIYKERNDSVAFLKLMDEKYDSFIDNLERDKNCHTCITTRSNLLSVFKTNKWLEEE